MSEPAAVSEAEPAPDQEPAGGGRFAPAIGAWRQGLGAARDAVRQELVARQLAAHLPPPSGGHAALDLGCGQGTQAIRLARAGYAVVGIDLSPELLDVAQRAAADEPAVVGERLRFEQGDLLDLGQEHAGRYDVVCCHGVLMYLPSPDEALAPAVHAARVGGLISVLTRNRAGIAMRAGMTGDWQGALSAFDARHYRNRLGVERARADEPAEVQRGIERAGGERVAWYGVRLFTDHWGAEQMPGDLEAVVAVEAEAGRRDPYRALAALTHTVALRR